MIRLKRSDTIIEKVGIHNGIPVIRRDGFMLNYIWLFMLLAGFIIGIMNGRVEEVTRALLESAGAAVELGIGLLGVICLWTGIMNIAEKSGIIRFITRLAEPVLRAFFPEIPRKHPAIGAMVMNLSANFLGLGNAATPLGLKAMKELQMINPKKDTATDSMSMFLVLNTAAVQLVPTTVIAIRTFAGSKNPAEIIGAVWVASISAAVTGVLAVKLLSTIYNGR
jgi:spore maturation protein A